MITLFWPDRLWRGGVPARVIDANGKTKIANWLSQPVGVFVDGEDWDGLCRWIATPTHSEAKEDPGAFTLARISGGRSRENVEFVTALGIDGDKTGVSAFQIHQILAQSGYRHVVYTTHSSRCSAPRWRAIIANSRPATGKEHDRYIKQAFDALGHVGISVDTSASDPCRLWYLPSYGVRENFECFVGDGLPFDVDAALASADDVDAQRRAEIGVRFRVLLRGDRVERARRYVKKMPAAIQHAEGSRATFAVARKLLRDFELAETDAWPILLEYNERCEPPWSEKELLHKIKSASRARIANPIEERSSLR